MTFDTLQYNGIERTFANRGFSRSHARLRKHNSNEDIFSVYIPTANITDDPIFPFESVVIVRTGRVSANGADNSFSGGTVKFTGKAMPLTGDVDGRKVGVTYEFKGPWYDLSNTHYLQTFKGAAVNPYNPGEIILNTSTASSNPGAFLFISIGDQVQAILQWLLDQYAAQGMTAPFQYSGRALNAGAIDLTTSGTAAVGINTDKSGNAYVRHVVAGPTIDQALFGQFLVSYIAKPMMCSQALQKMLELSPRTNISFDYSTTPPTIYVRSVDNFAPASLPIFNGIDHKSINIKRRDDVVARAVIITYRIANQIDGRQQLDFKVDKWGPNGANSNADPNAGLRVFSETIDLQGFNVTSTTAQLDCEPLACTGGTNATKRKWWSSRRGGEQAKFIDSRLRFQNNTFAETTIPNATLTYATNDFSNFRITGQPLSGGDLALFTNRIVRGTHHTWMTIGDNVPVQSLKVRVTMKTEHAEYDVVATGDTLSQLPVGEAASNTAINGNRHGKVNTEETHCEIELTNAVNKLDGSPFSSSTVASSTAPEVYILGAGGIAQYVFNSLQAFQYEGEYVKVETDFANNVGLTNAINFTGGRAEWTTMNAQPQSIIEDFGTKETYVQIGVSNDLTAGQLSSLLNMWAYRRPWYNPAVRADNTLSSGGEVAMPQTAGGANATKGVANHNDFVTTEYTTPGDPTTAIKGQVKLTAEKVGTLLAATTPTAVDLDDPDGIKKLEPRQIGCCDESGNTVQVIGLFGGFFSIP